jgi:hypothetical protein
MTVYPLSPDFLESDEMRYSNKKSARVDHKLEVACDL